MILKDTNEMFVDDLRNPTYAAGYLNISLEDDGIEGFLYALQKVARAHGISKVASDSDMPRESLYHSLSNKGNPGIKPLVRVLDALGLRLSVTPAFQTADQSVPLQEGCLVPDASNAEVSELRHMMTEGFAALREEMQVQQEAARREAERLRGEMKRVTALTE
jgi:probable addiction module antidote protein